MPCRGIEDHSMALTYQVFPDAGLPEVLDLWESGTAWGPFKPELWRHWFLDGPYGPSPIVAALDPAGQLVAQLVLIPGPVPGDGRPIRADRPFAPIVSEAARRGCGINPLDHPALRMYGHAVDAARADGIGLIFMAPDPRWSRAFRMIPGLRAGSFPLWSLPLPLAAER